MSLRTLLMLCAGLILSLLLAIAMASVNINKLQKEHQQISNTSLQLISEADKLLLQLVSAENALNNYLIKRDPEKLTDFNLANNQIPTSLRLIAEITESVQIESEIFLRFAPLVTQRLSQLNNDFQTFRHAPRSVSLNTINDYDRFNRQISGEIDAFKRQLQELHQNNEQQYLEFHQFSLLVHWLLAIASLIALIVIWRMMHQHLTQPLQSMIHELEELGRNPYHEAQTLPTSYLVEVNQLCHHFNQTSKTIKQTIGDLELRKTELTMANKAKTAFLANMSHELRTPLMGILSTTEVLQNSQLCSDLNTQISAIQSSAQRLSQTINNILDITHFESGNLPLKLRPFKLKELLDKVVANFAHRALQKSLKIELENSESRSLALIGDVERIEQILNNLVDNALKFTERGFIHIHCACEFYDQNNCLLCIDVVDTGIGMTPEQTALIFEQFEKPISNKHHYRGVGLGLAISQKLSQAMKGSLKVKSSPNMGTQIAFTLPLHVYENELPIEETTSKPSLEQFSILKGVHILVAEDDDINQMVISEILSNINIRSTCKDNGKQALDALINDEQRYDLILMDLEMPILDGIETTHLIRRFDKTTPIIALTANTYEMDQEAAMQAGMNGFLGKPIKTNQLYSLLIKHLSSVDDS